MSTAVSLRPSTWCSGRGTVQRRSGSASAVLAASQFEVVTVSNLAFDLDAGSLSSAVAIFLGNDGEPTVRNSDHAGIVIDCAMDGVLVTENHVHNAPGIRVKPRRVGSPTR